MLLKIITLNCFYDFISLDNISRLDTGITEILKLNPDIICLQEIVSKRQINLVKKRFKNTDYQVFNKEGIFFNTGGLVFASKLPILKKEFIKFKKQGKFFSLQISDRIISKGYQKILVKINSQEVHFFNAHLVSRYNRSSKQEKIEQAYQLDQLSDDLVKDRSQNKICIGDLNIKSYHDLYLRFIGQTGLFDHLDQSFITYSPENTNSKQSFSFDHNSRIDYILSSPSVKEVETSIIFKNEFLINNKKQHISDHFGVQSVFEI